MAYRVTYDTSQLKDLTRKITNLENMLPIYGDRITGDFSKACKRNIRNEAPYWRGHLQEGIRVRKKGEGNMEVLMPFYGRFVDKGTGPHEVSEKNIKLMTWARDKKISFSALRSSIKKRGTRANPFIKRGITAALHELNNIEKVEVERMIMDAGFGKA